METRVADVDSWCKRDTEGLNAAIQVLVIQGILIMPNSSRRIGNFVAQGPDTVITGIGLELGNGCVWPDVDGRPHPRRRTNR
jgi:hypothetical protein